MTKASGLSQVRRFGTFEFDPVAGELHKHGMKIKLQGQPIEILAMLLEHPGQVVTREEIQKKLWAQDTNVEFEHSVNAAVKRLRHALDDSADTPRYVETLARRGYRFIHSVDGLEAVAGQEKNPSVGRRAGPRVWLISVVGVVLFVAGYLAWTRLRTPRPPAYTKVLVLPFVNLSRDPEQEFFSDALTEEMISQLGDLQPERLGVIARTTAMHYKSRSSALITF